MFHRGWFSFLVRDFKSAFVVLLFGIFSISAFAGVTLQCAQLTYATNWVQADTYTCTYTLYFHPTCPPGGYYFRSGATVMARIDKYTPVGTAQNLSSSFSFFSKGVTSSTLFYQYWNAFRYPVTDVVFADGKPAFFLVSNPTFNVVYTRTNSPLPSRELVDSNAMSVSFVNLCPDRPNIKIVADILFAPSDSYSRVKPHAVVIHVDGVSLASASTSGGSIVGVPINLRASTAATTLPGHFTWDCTVDGVVISSGVVGCTDEIGNSLINISKKIFDPADSSVPPPPVPPLVDPTAPPGGPISGPPAGPPAGSPTGYGGPGTPIVVPGPGGVGLPSITSSPVPVPAAGEQDIYGPVHSALINAGNESAIPSVVKTAPEQISEVFAERGNVDQVQDVLNNSVYTVGAVKNRLSGKVARMGDISWIPTGSLGSLSGIDLGSAQVFGQTVSVNLDFTRYSTIISWIRQVMLFGITVVFVKRSIETVREYL